MPKIQATPTPTVDREELERQAAELNAQLDAIRERERREQEEAERRRAEAEAEWDRRFLADVTPAQLEQDVEQAAQALDEALATNPLVVAFAAYYTQLRRRSNLRQELSSARMRIGQDPLPAGARATEIMPDEVLDLLLRAAARIAGDQVRDELADLYAKRTAAGDAAAQREG